MSNHFIAVGGTGQHVALAYIDLAALSYLFLGEWRLPAFCLLDADVSDNVGNAAWQKFIEMLERMQSLEMNVENFRYLDPFDNELQGNTFNETVNDPQRPWLFDEDQRNVRYRNGYYGHAAVGATVFNHTYRRRSAQQGTPFFSIQDQIRSPGSRFFVTGSSVGGTGAGCLPRLVESLAKFRDPTSLLAACLFLPWFRLEGDAVQGHFEDADRRNSEMRTRASSAFLYLRDRFQEHALTLVLGHPNVDRAGSRPWQSDTRQSYHRILTLPYYGAIAASNLFFQNGNAGTGLFTMVCPPLVDGDMVLPDSAWTFNGVATADNEARTTFRFANLINSNVSLCYLLAVFLTYTRWSKPVRWALFPERLVIHSLDQMQENVDRIQKILELKMIALKRIYDFQPSIFKNQRQLKELMEFDPQTGILSDLRGVDDVRELLPINGGGQEGKVPKTWIQRSLMRLEGDDDLSTERCMPSLPQHDAAPIPGVVGTTEDITNLPISETLIRLDHIDAYAVPSTAAIRFLLQSFFNRYAVDPMAAAGFEKGRELAERLLMLLKGVASGKIIVDRYPTEIGRGRISLTDCYNEMISEPANYLQNQVGLYLKGSDENELLAVSDPETLLCPSIGIDWVEIEGELRDSDLRITQGTKTLKGWLLFLSDMHDALHGLAQPKPEWLHYLLEHPDLRVNDDPSFQFDLLDDGLTQLFKVSWSENSRSFPLAFPAIGKRDRQKLENQIVRFGFREVRNVDFQDHLGVDTPPEVINVIEFLRDESSCPRFSFFSKQGNETRIAVWADINDDIVRDFRFGFCFTHTPEVGAMAWCINTPRELDILPSTDPILLNSVAPLASKVTLRPGEEPVYPDYPVKASYADLIDTGVRFRRQVNEGGRNITYTFQIKGRVSEETCTPRIQQIQPCTIAFWPKFEVVRWRAYYAFVNFSVTNSVLVVFMVEDDSPRLSTRTLPHHLSGQPLYDLREMDLRFDKGGRPKLFTVLPPGDTERGVGLFRVELQNENNRRVEVDQWGVDFGTYSTVVAARAGDAERINITTAARHDQTLVVTKDDSRAMDSWAWFPSFNPDPTSSGTSLFPSLMTSLNQEVDSLAGNLNGMSFKRDFTINATEKSENYEKEWGSRRGTPSFKWFESKKGGLSEQNQRQLRRSYLLHLIEICLALRVGMVHENLQSGLPLSIDATFGLPLRMWDQFRNFREDVRSVVASLSTMTGVQFNSHFQWESLAGRLMAGADNYNIYVVADLGGGSIDLWGGYYPDINTYQWADSFRFGGDDLLRQLDRDFHHEPEQSLLHRMRYEPQATLDYVIEGQKRSFPTIQGAYDLTREILARWAAAIAVECYNKKKSSAQVAPFEASGEHIESGKNGIDSVFPVKVDLLGMGWMLNETTRDNVGPYVDTINGRANQLLRESNQSVRVNVKPRISGSRIGEHSKTELACRLAQELGDADLVTTEDGVNPKEKPKTFNLVDVVDWYENGEDTSQGKKCNIYRWEKQLPYTVESQRQGSLEFLLDQQEQPTPKLNRHRFDESQRVDLVSNLRRLPDSSMMLNSSPFRIMVEYLRLKPRTNRI